MKFALEIHMDSAAFADGEGAELYALLGDVRTVVAMGLRGGIVRDSNGNRVGAWEIGPDPIHPDDAVMDHPHVTPGGRMLPTGVLTAASKAYWGRLHGPPTDAEIRAVHAAIDAWEDVRLGDGYDCSGGCRHHCGDQAADWCGRSLSEGWCPEHGYGTPPR